jgi:hypothetical protein
MTISPQEPVFIKGGCARRVDLVRHYPGEPVCLGDTGACKLRGRSPRLVSGQRKIRRKSVSGPCSLAGWLA